MRNTGRAARSRHGASSIAVNANTGDIAWRVPLGEYPELVAKGIPMTGAPRLGGAITTAGNLVFIGATIDGIFRAIDARNGKELWREKLERRRIRFRPRTWARTASSTSPCRRAAADSCAARPPIP